MSVLIDKYPESNANYDYGNYYSVGQSFKNNVASTKLDSVKFYMKKSGSPTGNIVAQVYNHTGTYGTSSLPTGSALATSDNVDVSTIGTSLSLINFNFSGVNRITLSKDSIYVVVYQYGNGNSTNFVVFYGDNTSPTHSGNLVKKTGSGSAWAYDAAVDSIFYVFGESPITGQKYALPAVKR